jgi:hypothetical protein
MSQIPRQLHLRVFLASPGEVVNERTLAREVVDLVQYDARWRGLVPLETIAWDTPGAVPMIATTTPQASVAHRLPNPSECDIVVVIFWARVGTPLPPQYTKPDGTAYASGPSGNISMLSTRLSGRGAQGFLCIVVWKSLLYMRRIPKRGKSSGNGSGCSRFSHNFEVRTDHSAADITRIKYQMRSGGSSRDICEASYTISRTRANSFPRIPSLGGRRCRCGQVLPFRAFAPLRRRTNRYFSGARRKSTESFVVSTRIAAFLASLDLLDPASPRWWPPD